MFNSQSFGELSLLAFRLAFHTLEQSGNPPVTQVATPLIMQNFKA